MKVSINGQEYKYKYSIRALFVFEKIAGKTFCLESTMDFFIFYYSMLLANNPDMTLSFDEFIDVCDEDPEVIRHMQEYLSGYFTKQSQLTAADNNESKKSN